MAGPSTRSASSNSRNDRCKILTLTPGISEPTRTTRPHPAANASLNALHADTLLEPGKLDLALQVLQQNPDIIGGAIGNRFDGTGILLRVLELANDMRAAYLGISFGDQVQFFRRAPMLEYDLVPVIPLMEDVELSLRMRSAGDTVFLWGRCLVSSRRWQRGSACGVVRVISLCTRYLFQRLWREPDTIAMYHEYYGARRSSR